MKTLDEAELDQVTGGALKLLEGAWTLSIPQPVGGWIRRRPVTPVTGGDEPPPPVVTRPRWVDPMPKSPYE